MRRRIIIILIAVCIIVAALFLLFRKGGNGQEASNGNSGGSLPVIETGGINNYYGSSTTVPMFSVASSSAATSSANQNNFSFGIIYNGPTLDYYEDPDNDVWVIQPDGEVLYIDPINGETVVSTSTIKDISYGSFSYDGEKILAVSNQNSSEQANVFDVKTNKWITMAANVVAAAWSPNDERLAYVNEDVSGNETLETMDFSKSNPKPVTLASINTKDITIAWPNENEIAISEKPSEYEAGNIWLYNITKKTWSVPFSNSPAALNAIWSEGTTTYALVFQGSSSGRGGILSLWNSNDGLLNNLNFLTLPNKCVFNEEFGNDLEAPPAADQSASTTPAINPAVYYTAFYCAVPQDTDQFSSEPLPDAYYQKAIFTSDDFIKVRADDGIKQPFLAPPIPVDAIDLKIINNVLFFVNRYDQKLYAMSVGD